MEIIKETQERTDYLKIIALSEPDILKFNSKIMEIYTTIPPETIFFKSVTLSNLQNQNGIITIFNLYLEVICNKADFEAWTQSLKIKNQIIR